MKKRFLTNKSLFVAIFGIATIAVALTPSAAWAATRTWDGGAADNNWNSATNWSTDTAPVAGDDLVFPANVADRTAVNNITAGTSFNSITFSGTPSSDSSYTLSGNSFALVAGITNSMSNTAQTIENNIAFSSNQTINTGDYYLVLDGVLSGSGNLTKTGTGSMSIGGANTFTGTLTANAGQVVITDSSGLGTTAGNTVINDGAGLSIQTATDMTVAEPIVLTGAGIYGSKLNVTPGMGGVLDSMPTKTVTFSGAITLNSDIVFGTYALNANLASVTTNGYNITRPDGTFGTLTVNGVVAPASAYLTSTFSGDLSNDFEIVGNHNIATLNGNRAGVTVYYDGTLKGGGNAGELIIRTGATLSPGQSPGCMASGPFTMAGTLVQEIASNTACTGYDQMQVAGSVTLSGTLTVSLLNGFSPTKNQVYTIITNDGSDAVSGTFAGLGEGAVVTIGSAQFRVSYVGGDGNDVTLTALNTPGVPNTGAALVTGNPVLVSALGVGAAIVLVVVSRKYLFSKK